MQVALKSHSNYIQTFFSFFFFNDSLSGKDFSLDALGHFYCKATHRANRDSTNCALWPHKHITMNTGVDLFLPYVTCYVGSEGHFFFFFWKTLSLTCTQHTLTYNLRQFTCSYNAHSQYLQAVGMATFWRGECVRFCWHRCSCKS